MVESKNLVTPVSAASRKMVRLLVATALLTMPLFGCSDGSTDNAAQTDAAPGSLQIQANGEDFVRQGFVDKDGWQISFDHVYVTLANMQAAQSDPPFEAGKSQPLTAQALVEATGPITVDLAAGDASADPILVTELPAESGRYNAFAWELVAPAGGPSAGYPLVMIGTATKADETISFELQLSDAIAFSCGDFIGEERKGIVTGGDTAAIEATFHFDHIFGDAEAAADDEINTGALGFEALAALANAGDLTVTSQDLEKQLTSENYNTLKTVLMSLGHVGEGHCEATPLTP